MRVPLKHDDGVPKMVLSHVNSCELSEGWINLSLFDICRPKQWKTISAKELTSEGYPVYGANGKIGFYSDYNHERPTILITCRGATCGRINISEQRSYVNGNAMALDDLDENVVLLKFAAYALEFRGLDDTITGSAQPQITRASLERVSLSVPPLAEQRRIVAKLETLLGKVSSSQQRLARIPGLLKCFRQSVLAAACSGQLTADWRDKDRINDDLPIGWRRVILDDLLPMGGIFDGPFGSNLKTSDYTSSGIRVVRLENIGHLEFNAEKETFISEGKYETLLKHTIGAGDIIFASFISDEVRACVLPKLGTAAIAKADCFCIRPLLDRIDRDYLCYQLVTAL